MRKNQLQYAPFDAVSLATNQISSDTTIAFLDNVGIVVSWTGTSPLGELFVEVTNDQDPVTEANWNWVPLDFGSQIVISGNSGSHIINIAQCPFAKIRLRYVRTSGTGTLTARMSVKQVGG